jgi:hypothetical protein
VIKAAVMPDQALENDEPTVQQSLAGYFHLSRPVTVFLEISDDFGIMNTVDLLSTI